MIFKYCLLTFYPLKLFCVLYIEKSFLIWSVTNYYGSEEVYNAWRIYDLPCLPYVFIAHLVICLHESYENWKKEEIKKHWIKKHNLNKAGEKQESFEHCTYQHFARDWIIEFSCLNTFLGVKTCSLNSLSMYSN